MGIGPALRPLAWSRKVWRRAPVLRSLAVWVMALGSLTEKRKLGGVEAAQRSQVLRWWGRWKLELISTQWRWWA